MRAILSVVLAVGCARVIDDDQPCAEARIAMAARLEECTGDSEAASALLDKATEETECQWPDGDPRLDTAVPGVQTGVYECAFVLRNLACEIAEANGQDVDAWLAASPVCQILLVPR